MLSSVGIKKWGWYKLSYALQWREVTRGEGLFFVVGEHLPANHTLYIKSRLRRIAEAGQVVIWRRETRLIWFCPRH